MYEYKPTLVALASRRHLGVLELSTLPVLVLYEHVECGGAMNIFATWMKHYVANFLTDLRVNMHYIILDFYTQHYVSLHKNSKLGFFSINLIWLLRKYDFSTIDYCAGIQPDLNLYVLYD